MRRRLLHAGQSRLCSIPSPPMSATYRTCMSKRPLPAALLCALLLTFVFAPRSAPAAEKGKAEHVVVVVWDGMRPDFITAQYTPTLFKLAKDGVFFKNHHPVYVSSTEVNGTAIATGCYPDRTGIIANSEYDPELGWVSPHGTESLDAMRRGDLLTGGKY